MNPETSGVWRNSAWLYFVVDEDVAPKISVWCSEIIRPADSFHDPLVHSLNLSVCVCVCVCHLTQLFLSRFPFRLLSENSILSDPIEFPNMKRHSEGTFSNDYSKYLETRRAQDFVQWLKNSKRNGWVHENVPMKHLKHMVGRVTFPNVLTWQMFFLLQEFIQTPCRRHLHQRRELLPAGPGSQRVCLLVEDRPRQKRLNSSAAVVLVKRCSFFSLILCNYMCHNLYYTFFWQHN